MGEIDERLLVGRAKGGDTQAFDHLFGLYGQVVYNLALRMVGDAEEARDLTQSAFLKAWKGLQTFDTSRRFFSWLYRIALNESLSYLRDRRPGEPLDDLAADPSPGPEEKRRDRLRRDALQAGLMDLGNDDRQLLVLRYFGQLSYGELAEMLEVSEKTIKSRLFTARQTLGRALKRRGFASNDL